MARKMLVLSTLLALLAGPAYAGKTQEANIKLCKKFYAEVVNAGNLDMLDKMMTDDFVEHETTPGLEPGREGVKQFFRMMREAFPDLNFDVEFYMADGDRVAAYVAMSGTHKGEFMGMSPTGRKFSVHAIDILRVVDGKAAEHWGVTDAMAMMEQLGALGNEGHEGHGH